MTYKEFLDLSPIEITNYLTERGITKIQDIDDEEKFIEKSGIIDIHSKDFLIYVCNSSLTKGYSYITFYKIISKDIIINIELYFSNVYKKAANASIKLEKVAYEDHYSFSNSIRIFKKKYNFFNSVPGYNFLELYYLPKLSNLPEKGNIDKKLSEVYNEIINYRKKIDPVINQFIEFIDNGSFVETYNKYNKDKFKIGNMPFVSEIFQHAINEIYSKTFNDFEDYLIYASFISSKFKYTGDVKKYFLENKEYCKEVLIKEVSDSNKDDEKADLLYEEFCKFVDEACQELDINKSDVYGCIFYKQICKNLKRE